MLGALLLLLACGCAAHRAGTASIAEVEGDGNKTVTGLLASSLMSNIEKTDEVDNKVETAVVKVENNAAKIDDIEARLTMRDNKADPIQTIVYGVIALAFMIGMITGAWKLVEYLLHKSECRAKECTFTTSHVAHVPMRGEPDDA